MTNIKDTLKERGERYGDFADQARISQALKSVVFSNLANHISWAQHEALGMICHKLARIVNGDPNHIDSWIDIAGYATLVVNHLEKGEKNDA